MIREPAVAGQFYPASAQELKSMIQGMVDEKAHKEDVIGYYAPHAGYVYSGPVVGATVSRVKFKDTCVILGPSHTGVGAPFSILTEGTWRTPLGDVEIDTELAKAILANCSHLKEDRLGASSGTFHRGAVAIYPIFQTGYQICADYTFPHQRRQFTGISGTAIAKAIKDTGKEAVIVASGDMNHYESQKITHTKDRQAIESILKLDAAGIIGACPRIQYLDVRLRHGGLSDLRGQRIGPGENGTGEIPDQRRCHQRFGRGSGVCRDLI